jgi:hypothetical protein
VVPVRSGLSEDAPIRVVPLTSGLSEHALKSGGT